MRVIMDQSKNARPAKPLEEQKAKWTLILNSR